MRTMGVVMMGRPVAAVAVAEVGNMSIGTAAGLLDIEAGNKMMLYYMATLTRPPQCQSLPGRIQRAPLFCFGSLSEKSFSSVIGTIPMRCSPIWPSHHLPTGFSTLQRRLNPTRPRRHPVDQLAPDIGFAPQASCRNSRPQRSPTRTFPPSSSGG